MQHLQSYGSEYSEAEGQFLQKVQGEEKQLNNALHVPSHNCIAFYLQAEKSGLNVLQFIYSWFFV